MPAARATAIATAVARHLETIEAAGFDPGRIDPTRLVVSADGSVSLTGAGGRLLEDHERDDTGPSIGTEAGASVGRLLFELLVGRAPLGREDAFEPVLVSSLSPRVCALMARSLSDAPGQWPTSGAWRARLEEDIGGQAPPLPPAEQRRQKRHRALMIIGLVVLVGATIAILAMAPVWWSEVNERSLGTGPGSLHAVLRA